MTAVRPLPALLLAALIVGAGVPAARAQPDAPSLRAAPPTPPEVTLVKALTRLHAADPAAAVALLTPALDTHPGHAALLGLLADATLALGDRTSARLHAREAADAAPSSADAALRLARLEADAGDRNGAQRTLDGALGRVSESERPRLLDGALDLALDARDDGRATATARRLAADGTLVPTLLDAARRVRLLAVLDRTDAALAATVRTVARRLDPLSADASRPAAAAPAAAVPSGSTPVSPSPGAAPASTRPAGTAGDARAAFAAGRFADAAPALAAAVEATPTDGALWRLAAMAWIEAGRPADAAPLLDDARLIFAGDAALLAVAAWHALATGDAPAARAALADADAALADAPDAASADPALVRRALDAVRAAVDGRALAPDDALAREGLAPSAGGALAARLVAR